MEDILSTWLSVSDQQDFTVIIADRISGGRLEEAIHKPIACLIRDGVLIVEFERGERLMIYDPSGVTFGPNAELTVDDGSEARFTWYQHGRPQNPENMFEESYRKVGNCVIFQCTGPPLAILDPFPTLVPLGCKGVGFVRLVQGW